MSVLVFWERGFPAVDALPVARAALAAAFGRRPVAFVGAAGLAAALAREPALLVLPYGSAFPKAAWPAVLAHLRRGGRWLNLGGAPLTRPVRRERGAWVVEPHQSAYGKECMIRHAWEIPLPGRVSCEAPPLEAAVDGPGRVAGALARLGPETLWSLQVLPTANVPVTPEPGAHGARLSAFRPVVQAWDGPGRNGQPLGAPVAVIDGLHGPFAGGRWVLAACRTKKPFDAALLRALAGLALQPAVRLEVRPGFACYHPGEQATAVLRAAGRDATDLRIDYRIAEADGGRTVARGSRTVSCRASDAYLSTPPAPLRRAGLYLVRATASLPGGPVVAAAENGFWLYDGDFMASAAPLSADRDYFRRGGKPFPVAGTTYMSGETHRAWMVEPTPAVWDRDFAAMRRAGVNLVRTGFWMGWRRMMLEPGAMDEAVVRSVQAFLLAARRHDLPVILTVFAFLPETWGGTNPYLDPAALAAQSSFLAALARRLGPANHLLWDLINEPSYAHPQGLWSFRPSGDAAEAGAWEAWRAAQGVGDDEWRERWGLTPGAALSVPAPKELGDLHHQDDSRPLRAADFARFSQEAFAGWAARLREVIRAGGNPRQLVTVGQDEAGAGRSPNPHFHAAAVDFTSNHPWWQNDDTLWDSVMTKTDLCPNLLEEVGVMFAEGVAGRPQRSPERVRDLLERKLVLSFAGGCAGFVQWLWNTAVYNNSDNEAGIGLLRADGSAKPELAAFSAVAAFVRRHAEAFAGREPERVVLVVPHSNLFGVRNTATEATKRAVRALEYRLGVPCRAVSEMFPERIGAADLIVLPAPRVLREACWQALLARVRAGATLAASGYLEDDEYWRPRPRLARFGLATRPVEVAHEEALALSADPAAAPLRVAFSSQPWHEKAVDHAGRTPPVARWRHGRGRILYCPAPVECALGEEPAEAFYRAAAGLAGLACAGPGDGAGPGLLVRPVVLLRHVLFLVVNEADGERPAVLRGAAADPRGGDWRHEVRVPAGRSAMFLVGRRDGRLRDACLPS